MHLLVNARLAFRTRIAKKTTRHLHSLSHRSEPMKTRSKFKFLSRADIKEPSRIDWSAIKPHVVVNESIQASLILFALAIGALKLPMLLGLWMLELVIVTALTASFFPQRGRKRAALDVAKMIFMCGFLSVFLIACYTAAGGVLRFESWSALSAAALLALRLASSARDAKKAPDPKRAWAGAALARGAVVLLGMVLGIFAGFLLGLPLASALRYIAPDVAPDVALGLILLAVQVFFAVLLSTMSEEEFKGIVGNPYLD
jgi:hypothetical protein